MHFAAFSRRRQSSLTRLCRFWLQSCSVGAALSLGLSSLRANTPARATGDTGLAATVSAEPVRAAQPGEFGGRREAVLINTAIADYKTLEAGVPNGAAIVEFDGHRDGLAQIAGWAKGQSGYDAIHIVSHGREGALELGTHFVDNAALQSGATQAELAELGHALKRDGDLMLYGCNVAAGPDGDCFINALAVATHAHVAASSDATGASAKGGNWTLEKRVGTVQTAALNLSDYNYTLGDVVTGNDPGAAYSNTNSDARADVAQSFTATKTGILKSITLYGSTTSNSTLNIYSGDGVSGTLLATQSVPAFNAAGDPDTGSQRYIGSTITLSSTVNIASGNQYTFQLTNADGVSITYTTNSDYPGGTAYDTGSEIGASLDFEFGVDQADPLNSAPTNTVVPAISGTAKVGSTVSSTTGTWTDADADSLTYSYQWYRADDSSGTNATAIGGAATSSYTLTTSDANRYVRVVVTANDGNGHTPTANSAWTAVVNSAPTNTVVPAISGTTTVGNTLSATTGTWADADGDPLTYSYQWYRADDSSGTNTTAIGAAVTSSYTLTSSDGNKYVRIVVTANDSHGHTPTANSAWTVIYTVPTVSSIVRTGGASASVNTSATSVNYTVTFSESVGGVDATDFTLTETGTAFANIASVSGSGTTYTITADTISGDGTLRLDLNSSGTGIKSGNNVSIVSGYTSGQAYTLDHTSPSAPSTPDLASASDTGVSNTDNITSNTTPTFTGTAEAGSTVTLYDTDGTTVLGTTTATGGAWSITSSSLSSGAHTLTAKASDAAGNVSSASSGLSVTIDNSAPTGLNLSSTLIATQNATATSTIGTLSATDALSVTFSLDVGNGTNDADNGSFTISGTSLKIGASSLTAGTYKIYIAATDLAGNIAHQAYTITIADAPSVTSIVRTGGASAAVSGSASSISFTVTFSEAVTGVDASDFSLTATGTANGSVASVSGSGTTYTVTVNTLSGDGTLRLDLNSSGTGIQNGGSLGILAGYTSGSTYTLDHTAPNAPSTPDMNSISDTGVSNSDNVTSDTAPIFSGTAETNSTVTLYDTDGTTVLGTGTATGGNWSIQSSALSEGSHSITAKASDAAGNVSSASSSLSVTIDTTAPTVLSVSVPANGVYGVGANLDFTVNFSENVTVNTGGGTPRLALVVGASTVYANYSSGSGTSALLFRYTVTSGASDLNGITVGALSANGATLRDLLNLDAVLTLNSVGSTAAVLVDGSGPSVASVVRAGATPTHSTSIDYTVTFSKAVSGVDVADFTLTATGTAAGTVATVTPVSSSVYTVSVNSVTGNGTLRLDLKSAGTGITDTASNPIDGGFTAGEVYTIDTTAPTVTSILRQAPMAVNVSAASTTWRITFSEGITGLDPADFTLTTVAGTAGGTVSSMSAVDTATYDVTVSPLSGHGQLRLDLNAAGTGIADLASVALADGGFATGDVYLIGATSVFDAVSLSAGTARSVSGTTGNKVAQRFTTSASAPLSLTTVAALIGNVSGMPAPVVTIHADDSSNGISAAVLGTLTNPASLTANTLNIWTGSVLLAANTSYWIVFDDTSSTGAYEVQASAATTGGSGNWLGNSDYFYRFGANAVTGPQTGSLQIALGANAVSTITSSLTANGTYGAPFSYAITATNTPTSFGATGLPTGLSTDPATGQISGTPAQTGSFSILLTASNAEGTGQVSTLTLTVAKAPLTVTAVSQSRAYAIANPTLTMTYSGFVGADSTSSLTTLPTATTSAGLSSPVGMYSITASGGVSDNYAFTYIDGVLTVTKANATVSLSGLSSPYSGAPQPVTATTSIGSLGITLTYNGSATIPSAPGTYTVVATVNDTNYQGTVTSTLIIEKLAQTIAFDAPAERDTTAAPFALNASASSSLPVSFTVVSGPAVVSGDMVSLTGAPGAVTITASQPGDSIYFAAADVSRTFTVNAAQTDRLINVSSRARVSGNGEGALISGFVIGGTQPKRVLLRAIGPALATFGVNDALANPRLRLYDGAGHVMLENDDWTGTETADAMAQTGAFSLPSGSHDAAVVTTLAPGAYTMLVLDGGQTGTVLAEVYDASLQPAAENQRLINISGRGMVDTNGGPLIGGFVITGNAPKKVLIRGAGPSLAAYGISHFLTDPKLKVYDGNGVVVAQNDDWSTPGTVPPDQTAATASEIAAAEQATGAFAFAAGSTDAALVVTLPPGAHTAVVSGAPGATGVALVEIYEMP